MSHEFDHTMYNSIFQSLLDQTSEKMAIVDTHGNVISASENFRNCWLKIVNNPLKLGHSFASLVGQKSFSQFIQPTILEVMSRNANSLQCSIDSNVDSPLTLASTFTFSLCRDVDGENVAVIVNWTSGGSIDDVKYQLREAHQRADDFAKASSDWQWEMGPDLTYTWFSDRLHDIYGVDPKTFLGRKRSNLAKENLDRRWREHLETLDAHLPFQNFDYELDFGDGNERWCRINGVPFFDMQNNFSGYRGTGTDITEIKLLEHEADATHTRFMRAIDHFPGAFILIDIHDNVVAFNAKLPKMYELNTVELQPGIPAPDLLKVIGNSRNHFESEEEANHWVTRRMSWIKNSNSFSDVQQNGCWYRATSHCLPDKSYLVTMLDITNRKENELAIANERKLLRSLIDSIPDSIYATDKSGRYTVMNAAKLKRLGHKKLKQVKNQLAYKDYDVSAAQELMESDNRVLMEGDRVLEQEYSINLSNGKKSWITYNKLPLHDQSGEIVGLVHWERDITDAHQMAQELHYQAHHDALTKLPNRLSFEQRLTTVCESVNETSGNWALGFLDLDQFKIVNDTAGHTAGDHLLQQISSKIAKYLNTDETLARLGGDEFGLLLNRGNIERSQQVAQNIIHDLDDFRFDWNGRVFSINASIGLAEISPSNNNAANAMSQADMACYTAKEQGRARSCLYHHSDSDHSKRHLDLQAAAGITEAIEQNRLVLYAQPIAAIVDGALEISHLEVLLRMQGKNGELIPPGSFIPAAERFGLMNRVDRWVVKETLDKIPKVLADHENIGVTINLSGQTLTDEALVDRVRLQLHKSGVSPNRICFELTETAAISNLHQADKFIAAMKLIGCEFALDDFGSGLSSFSYIKHFPVDYLKIDGSFVKDILSDPADRVMVTAINQMGQLLGMKTIAEFVETQEIKRELMTIGVDYLQGYGVCKPVPFDENLITHCKHLLPLSLKAA